MPRRLERAGTITLWALALFVALYSARYFLDPPPVLGPPIVLRLVSRWLGPGGGGINLLAGLEIFTRHPVLVRLHVACGIVALVAGLFQFVGSLRAAHPAVHRAMGRVYLGAVFLAGSAGLPLAFLSMGAFPRVIGPSFGSLAVVWLFTSGMALTRARQRRFAEHRAWMLRSYSLTFAAVTVRLAGPLFLLLLGDAAVALNAEICSWPLNLLVAEWLVRRAPARPAVSPQPSAVS